MATTTDDKQGSNGHGSNGSRGKRRSSLMQAAVQAGTEAMAETEPLVVSGERNLLAVQDFGQDLGSLRKLFDLFEQKTELMRLLDVSSRAEGVRIYIGGESGVVPYEELSIVSAPYEVDGFLPTP